MIAPGEIACLDGFLTQEQCDGLMEELEFTLWRPSKVVSRVAGGALSVRDSLWRLSESTTEDWFGCALRREMRAIERRIARACGIPAGHFEPWQATRYGRGDDFHYHHDSGHWSDSPEGERRWTALLYLETPKRGGASHFRHLNRTIEARAGRLAVWDNLTVSGAPDPRMVHAALPVLRGHKTVLVSWAHERAFAESAQTPSTQQERTVDGVG
jgi:prolyl 4-hydroxylase